MHLEEKPCCGIVINWDVTCVWFPFHLESGTRVGRDSRVCLHFALHLQMSVPGGDFMSTYVIGMVTRIHLLPFPYVTLC